MAAGTYCGCSVPCRSVSRGTAGLSVDPSVGSCAVARMTSGAAFDGSAPGENYGLRFRPDATFRYLSLFCDFQLYCSSICCSTPPAALFAFAECLYTGVRISRYLLC